MYRHPNDPGPSTSNTIIQGFAPETVRPFPKAPRRKQINKGKKKRISSIYTETAVKEIIRAEVEERENKIVQNFFFNSGYFKHE